MKGLVVAVTLVLAALTARANLVQNPGFENAVETTWSAQNEITNWFGWGDVQSVDSGWKAPYEGSRTLVFMNWLGGGDGVEQKPAVSADTEYDFSFYTLWDSGYDGTLNVQVRWLDAGGVQLGSNTISWTMGSADAWTPSSLRVTSVVNSARAELNFDNSGGTAGALYLDAVNFEAAVIPEPAAAILGLLGAGLLLLRRRQK